MQSWLDLLLESTKESEAPERYFWWAGLAAISAVVGKKIYVQRGARYKLYPNIYVALVSAGSGLRKGIPVMLVKNLVQELDSIRVISGCNSIQGLIQELSQQKTFKSGAVVGDAQGILVSDEFDSFLTEDPKALTILTTLFNTHEHKDGWEKHLKHSPVENLKNPCLSLLVASNTTLFENVVKERDIKGGFIARTFIIYESERSKINSLMYSEEKIKKVLEEEDVYHDKLMTRLREISQIDGRMLFSEQASRYYEDWYIALCQSKTDDETGTYDRLGDQVIKVAILIALSKHDELIIKPSDLTEAIEASESCLYGVKRISLEKEKGDVNPVIAKVLGALLKAPGQEITRRRLMVTTHIEALILDRALETLQQRGAIETPKKNSQREIFYKMTRETYETYMKFKGAERMEN